MNKIQKIKEIIQKIDIGKIANYLTEHPTSQTLKQIIRYSRIIWEIDNEKVIIRLGVKIAYNLETICDKNKTGDYVKNEEEKKYWLELSEELFENTIGIENKK